MTLFDRDKINSFQVIVSLTAYLQLMSKFNKVGINRHVQINIATVGILQNVANLKGIDKLFKEVEHTEATNKRLYDLTDKIVELCEEHLSELLEQQPR